MRIFTSPKEMIDRIAELEAERHDLANRLTVALNKASWNEAAEKKIADLAECHGIDLRERDRRIHELYTELKEWRNGERQYPPAVEDYKELLKQQEISRDYKQDALRYRKLVSLWQDDHFNPAEFEQNLDAAIKEEE